MIRRNKNMTKESLEKEIIESLQKRKHDTPINELIPDISSLPNTIDRYITNLKGEECDTDIYYVVIIKTDHEMSFDDSYIAMYSKRTQHGMSYKDFLFRVTARTAVGVVNNFVNTYYELEKRGLIKNREWKCKFKCLSFNIDNSKTSIPSYKFIQP